MQFLGTVPPAIREGDRDMLMEAVAKARGMTATDVAQRVAATDAAAPIPAQLLTARLANVFQKAWPPNMALASFENIPETPIGAQSVEYAQRNPTGAIGRLGMGTGASDIPSNGNATIVTDYRQPAYFASVVRLSLRQKQSQAFLKDPRLDSLERDLEDARNVHLRTENAALVAGYGSVNDPYGLLNHPGVSRLFGTVAWGTVSNTGETVIQDAGTFLTYLEVQSSQVARTRKVFISQALWSILERRTYSSVMSTTLAQTLRTNFPDVQWIPTWQLNAGQSGVPSGYHGMFVQDTDFRYSGYIDLFQMPTLIPVQYQGFDDLYYIWHASGGFKSMERYAGYLGFVPV